MTRTQVCNYFLIRTTKENDQGCLKVLPEVSNNYSKDGYLKTFFNKKHYYLHRLIALEKFGDKKMKGMETRHTCNHSWCINPDHIFYGTSQENINDRQRANRQAKGSKNGSSKLTELQVKVIKSLLKQNRLSQSKIAGIFKVNSRTISAINTGVVWNHVKLD